RPLLAGLRIRLLVDLPGLEIEELGVANVLQHQRFLAVADDHPITLPDQHVGHAHLLEQTVHRGTMRSLHLDEDQTPEGCVGLLPSSSRRAITCAWISAAPSKIERMRASQSSREAGNSSANPLPPWICTALSAAAQATRAARSFAMPASRSQRRPPSFC